MRRLGGLLLTAGLIASAFDPSPAVAAAGPSSGACDDTLSASATIFGFYDPFSPSNFLASADLVISADPAKMSDLSFYVKAPLGTLTFPSGTEFNYAGVNFLSTTGSGPTMAPQGGGSGTKNANSASPNGYLSVRWGSNATETFGINFIFGAGWDQEAISEIYFDIVYICEGLGAFDDVDIATTGASSVVVNLEVASALQASYAGPTDFGEIGAVTSGDAPSRSVGGAFNVLSTGPYTFALSSEKNFRMSHLAAPVGSSADTVDYEVEFFGETLVSGSSFTTKSCTSAGITTPDYIPITATLLEGGVGKTPSPNYEDTLTITITPLAAGSAAPGSCP
jgi:spore coat protein U-like protein